METKKCFRCGKIIIKKSVEGLPYWKTKRFCSFSCASTGRIGYWKGKKLPYPVWNKGKPHPHKVWNRGLTTKTSKKVAEYGKKSGNSRLNKPKKPFRIMDGYRCIFKPEHFRACKFTKCVPEQVLIMEKHLGRFLKKKEMVHHINGNKLDNQIENLMLFPSKSDHMRWHAFNDPNSGLRKRWENPGFSKKSRNKMSKSLKEYK